MFFAAPVRAQFAPVTSAYQGCNVYFCTFLERTDYVEPYDDPAIPFLYSYWITGRVTLTDAARTAGTNGGLTTILGTIYLPPSEEYDAGLPFSVTPSVLTFEGGFFGGRVAPPPITGLIAQVSDDVFYPDGSYTTSFNDNVENALVAVPAVTVNPEPATLALVGLGLLGLGGYVKPRRRLLPQSKSST
jgi:hypothetical protein